MSKLMDLRRDGRCADCDTELPTGTTAYWLRTERIILCVPCHAAGAEDRRAEMRVELTSATAQPVGPKTSQSSVATDHQVAAGGSAEREYEKRAARELAKKERRIAASVEWRVTIKNERPVLGRLAAALTPKPRMTPESHATKAWKIGAEGERRVAEVLADVVGIEVLHDRLVPRSSANIDHIAIGPSGVYVIDAKKYTGQIAVRNVGGVFRTDERLYINNRDRTKLVEGICRQVDVVRAALGHGFAEIPVHGVLCFVGCEWGLRPRTKKVNGVTALWPTALPEHVAAIGGWGDQRSAIADRLRSTLKPAV